MAVLADGDRVECWADWMREVSAGQEACGITKVDLRAAVNATDDWINTNAAAYNLAFPLAARANLTAAQKARLLALVIRKRFLAGA